MGVLSGGNFADLLEPGLKSIFDRVVSRPEPMLNTLFGVEPSTKFEEHYQGMGARGLVPLFQGTVNYQGFDAGYRTDIRNYELADGMQVERQLVDDDQYGEIRRRGTSLSDSFAKTIEHDAAQLWINAFTDSGTDRLGRSTNGADGVALLSTAHPHSPANTGDTQSNEGTLALSLDNYDTTRQAMMNLTDDKGDLMGIVPDTILVPTELERTTVQIFSERAAFEPQSAEFTVNFAAGKLNIVVWNRLTDANAWFLIDSRQMRNKLVWQWRIRPEFAQAGDFDGLKAKYRGYMRYGLGWTDWTWIHGNNPS